MYQIKAVEKIKIHFMPSTLLCASTKVEKKLSITTKSFIINIMGFFF